jgi:glycosyltransferase involved in cell wall biosynthesis
MHKNQRILVISNIFPGKNNPFLGIFVKNSLDYLEKIHKIKFIYCLKREIHASSLLTLLSYLGLFLKVLNAFFKKFDLVFAHMVFPSGFFGLILKWIRKKPLVIYAHGGDLYGATKDLHHEWRFEKYGIGLRIRYYLSKKTLDNTDRLVVGSGFLKQSAQKYFNFPENKIRISSMGVDTDMFVPGNHANSSEKTFVFCGRISRFKGIYLAISAFTEILAKRQDWSLMIVGPCQEKDLEELIISNGLERKITICGPVPQPSLVKHYQDAYCSILPSYMESFPCSVLESMACGTPVIASNVGGLPELIEDGQDGLLFECGDAEKLAEKIMYMLDNPGLRSSMSEMARKKAEEYTAAKEYDKIAGILSELV